MLNQAKGLEAADIIILAHGSDNYGLRRHNYVLVIKSPRHFTTFLATGGGGGGGREGGFLHIINGITLLRILRI